MNFMFILQTLMRIDPHKAEARKEVPHVRNNSPDGETNVLVRGNLCSVMV